MYIWIASSFNIYLLNYTQKYLPGNIFKNVLYSSLADLPVCVVGGLVYHSLGIRIALSGSYLTAMIGSITLVLFSEANPDIVPVMITFARSGIKATFDICYLANGTLFPAIFAGTSFGLCNMGAKIATIMSPMLAEVPPPVPMITFTVVAGLAALLATMIITKEKHNADK